VALSDRHGQRRVRRAAGRAHRPVHHRRGQELRPQPQRAIGPSEVGEPCERQLSYKILDWPETNTNRDPIAAIIGTGFHMWMAEKFEARQAPLPDGRPRYRIEERVTVRQGPTEASTLTGSSDLFDRLALLNNDWKLVGKSSATTSTGGKAPARSTASRPTSTASARRTPGTARPASPSPSSAGTTS
jgi:hypothetical protein